MSTQGAPAPREEVEVKLPARDLAEVREKLRAQQAHLRAPRHDEVNDLYDDASQGLSGSGRTLRLRRAAGRSILTYKGRARFQGGIKTREEREIEASDGAEAEGILEGLGFSRRFRYEKRREEWNFEECVVALDETPIGDFVEVEGDPTAIRKALLRLDLDFTDVIPYSYPELYRRRRTEEPSLPPDMIWAKEA